MKHLLLILVAVFLTAIGRADTGESNNGNNGLDELNPFAENIESVLKEYDREYENRTGNAAFDFGLNLPDFFNTGSCTQKTCQVYAQVVKSEQKLYLYFQGTLQSTWAISTGLPQYETPLLNQNPNGRIYDAYTSAKFPGGDYKGLGNMPYAVFIRGGFAVHGTAESNWRKLGTKASHGCIRLHPDNAQYFNRLIKDAGIYNSWVSVQD